VKAGRRTRDKGIGKKLRLLSASNLVEENNFINRAVYL